VGLVGLLGLVGQVKPVGRAGQVGHVGLVEGPCLADAHRAVSKRRLIALVVAGLAIGCAREAPQPATAAAAPAPTDTQHQGITTPHGDHTPHHGGLVLMNGELHYEVVLDPSGAHRVWFSDAVREDLPASIARDVRMVVARPDAAPETLALEIDEAGESWVAKGRPAGGDNIMVKVSYRVRGEPHEVEIPFVIPAR